MSVFKCFGTIRAILERRLWLPKGWSLGGFRVMLQSSLFDVVAFDPFAFFRRGTVFLQSGHGKRHVYFAACSARVTGQWRAALKDFWQLIATSLKRRAILNRYRRVVKRQHADEAKISSPHIRHFGLKAKPRFAPDM